MEKVDEIKRKVIHIITLVLPVLYMFLPRNKMLLISGTLLFLALLVEFLRYVNGPFSRLFYRYTDPMLRNHEKHGLTGATYLFCGVFIAILLFDKWVARSVIFFIIVSDGLAALAGRLWGRNIIIHGKTIEGSVVFLFSSLIIVLFIVRGNVLIGLAGITVSLFVEIFLYKINDNISIPIFGGGIMQLLLTLTR